MEDFQITSYYAHMCDHFETHTNVVFCGGFDDDDDDDEVCMDNKHNNNNNNKSSNSYLQATATRYAIINGGHRKPMKRCVLGAQTSMKDYCSRSYYSCAIVPACIDAHFLVDGNRVVIDYIEGNPRTLTPWNVHLVKHVRLAFNRGVKNQPAVEFWGPDGRLIKLEVDCGANVTVCKVAEQRRSHRRKVRKVRKVQDNSFYGDCSLDCCSDCPEDSYNHHDHDDSNGSNDESDESDDDDDDDDDGDDDGDTNTLYCNEFCRAVMYGASSMGKLQLQIAHAKNRYCLTFGGLVKYMLKWKALHMVCVSKNWAPGGRQYIELLGGETARAMSNKHTFTGKRKGREDVEEAECKCVGV